MPRFHRRARPRYHRYPRSGYSYSAPRRRSFRSRFHFRRHRDKRLSIIGTASAVGSIFVPQTGNDHSLGWWIVNFAQNKQTFDQDHITRMIGDTMGQYIGYNPISGQWGIPMGTAVIIAGGLASKVAGRFGNKYLKNIPFAGNYIKF